MFAKNQVPPFSGFRKLKKKIPRDWITWKGAGEKDKPAAKQQDFKQVKRTPVNTEIKYSFKLGQ